MHLILEDFFLQVFDYKNLVIDIQGNEGGATDYWTEYIMPYLIKEDVTVPIVYAFKDSERIQRFKPEILNNTIDVSSLNLPNIPAELYEDQYQFYSSEWTLSPANDTGGFNGSIYLLVDDLVYSSAETLAYFCKATKFAEVVGEKTSGDGIGTDPILLTLPESGVVIRFTSEMGLNPDGSANEETQTIPDILIEAESKKERLEKLLRHIESTIE